MEAETVGNGIAQRILIHKTREGERSLQTIYGAQETTEGQRDIEVRMKQKQN